MALIAAHLNAGNSGGDSVAIGIYSPSSPTSIPPSPIPNKPYGFCGRKASCLLTYTSAFKQLLSRDDDVHLNVLGCRVDILGTNCDQCFAWFNVALRPQKP